MHPARQQKPAFPLHHVAHAPALAEELRPAYFVDRLVGVLHDMELVVDDGAVGGPLLDAAAVGLPHVHAGRLDPPPLASAQLRPEELVQRLFLPFPAEPERLRALQITHHRDEFRGLPQKDLVHSQVVQGRLAALPIPAFQIAQIDGSDCTLGHSKLLGHTPRRSTLAGLSHGLLETFGERRLARQLLHLLDLQAAVRAAHPA